MHGMAPPLFVVDDEKYVADHALPGYVPATTDPPTSRPSAHPTHRPSLPVTLGPTSPQCTGDSLLDFQARVNYWQRTSAYLAAIIAGVVGLHAAACCYYCRRKRGKAKTTDYRRVPTEEETFKLLSEEKGVWDTETGPEISMYRDNQLTRRS